MTRDKKIILDTDLMKNHINDDEIGQLQPEIEKAINGLHNGTCSGSDFLGWLDLPAKVETQELPKVKEIANEIRENADYLIVIGIGGSYLGARAAIDLLMPSFEVQAKGPQVIYFGNQLSSDYAHELLQFLKDKSIYVNVISKSGTTTEPGVAFRIIKKFMQKRYSQAELRKRIIATTDRSKGALREMVSLEGYRDFIIPDDVGGRFSVLTPVGLLPIAAAGVNVDELLNGAKTMMDIARNTANIFDNPSVLYAAIRYLLGQKGKQIEILASFEPYSHYFAEWWKQLFGESEGKDGKGLFPTSVDFTTDLHSLGQYIQQGQRILFETFLYFQNSNHELLIPEFQDDHDGMNYLANRNLSEVNFQAYRGTTLAHYDGGVPNMTFFVPVRNAYFLGQLFYLFEYAVAISGLLLKVNPFNQPGVEAYKQNMFALLGKPGFEKRKEELDQLVKNLK